MEGRPCKGHAHQILGGGGGRGELDFFTFAKRKCLVYMIFLVREG